VPARAATVVGTTPEMPSAFVQSSALGTLRWNQAARALVKKNLADPLWAVRTYALVSIAQHDAARSVSGEAGEDAAARVTAAVAASSATVLARLYPHEVPRVAADREAEIGVLRKRAFSVAALERAIAVGDSVASALLEERDDDGSMRLDSAEPSRDSGGWYSSERWPSLRPSWGRVRPLLIRNVQAFATTPPPAVGSPEFAAALASVREYTRLASARHYSLARKWADGPGTATPPGHWNEIAADLIGRHGLDELESARVLALMNMAMMDASIVCWRAKYEHWLLRPPQADPTIVPSLPLPNFPSYPSGHAAFSAAAASFLAHRFPEEREELTRLAEEAARSRVVSGIHYPFDSDEGLRQGRRIADLAIAEDERGAPLLMEAIGSEARTKVSSTRRSPR
jgi:membrane-associated phospholipid phosphatase